MKVVLCTGWYLPKSVGGTELYVHSLASELQRAGVEVTVMAPIDGEQSMRYRHDDVQVVRYPVPMRRSPEQHAGDAPHDRFDTFQTLLRELRADVFHLHSHTFGCNTFHLSYARELRLRTLTTLHLPAAICARGTMMLYGKHACDGRILTARCTSCWAEAHGAPAVMARAVGPLWEHVGPAMSGFAAGRVRTLLDTPVRVDQARAMLERLHDLSDVLIAVCEWMRQALLANGFPEAKLVTCRQGVSLPEPGAERGPRPQAPGKVGLRIGFFGRATAVKGLDTIVQAVRGLEASHAVSLSVHALRNSAEDDACLAEAMEIASGDARVQFKGPVPAAQVPDAMRNYDVIAVPSRWLETGPLVAMEALAAGVPVLGSSLGGIAELVEDGVTGWLLPHDDVERWRREVERLCAPGAVKLSWPVQRAPLLGRDEVARRMQALYGATDTAPALRGGALR